MTDAATRKRVERLISETPVRAVDLANVFLYLRDRSDGRESLQEVGDFVAHHNERTKGLITRTTRDWELTARFATISLSGTLDSKQLPDFYPDYLAAALRRVEGRSLKKAKLSSTAARRILPRVSKRMAKNDDGTWRMPSDLDQREQSLVSLLSSTITARPAFDDRDLNRDFRAALLKLQLLERHELARLEKINPQVALFAVSVMHGSRIKVDDATSVVLGACPDLVGLLIVNATVSVATTLSPNSEIVLDHAGPVPDGRYPSKIVVPLTSGSLHFSTGIFNTSLDVATHCDSDLQGKEEWNFPLELGTGGKLSKI